VECPLGFAGLSKEILWGFDIRLIKLIMKVMEVMKVMMFNNH